MRSGTQKSFVAPLDTKPSKIGTAGARNTYLFFEAIKKLFKALILLGGAVLLWRTWKGKVEHVEFVLLILVSLAGLVALIVLPYISLKYDILRGYQQVLIPVASLAIIGLYAIIPRPLSPYKPAIACALFVLFFVYSAGMVGQIIGGTTVPMQLNNQGEEYNQYYVHKGEILSGQWIAMQNTRDPIFAGTRASDKLRLSYPSTIKKNIVTDVFPHTITNKGYVYTSWLNVRGREYVFVQGITIPYIYPTSFIDETKNLVYSNQDSRIYSR